MQIEKDIKRVKILFKKLYDELTIKMKKIYIYFKRVQIFE